MRTQTIFDKQDQFDKFRSGLLQGEIIIAVYDCIGAGTGFVGITDRRIIVQDNSFVGKKIALTSIPYSKINAVCFVFGQVDLAVSLELEHQHLGRPPGLHRGLPR